VKTTATPKYRHFSSVSSLPPVNIMVTVMRHISQLKRTASPGSRGPVRAIFPDAATPFILLGAVSPRFKSSRGRPGRLRSLVRSDHRVERQKRFAARVLGGSEGQTSNSPHHRQFCINTRHSSHVTTLPSVPPTCPPSTAVLRVSRFCCTTTRSRELTINQPARMLRF
jgi:hypothetical protein